MQTKTETLFSNHWDVRISDPGLEGAMSHYFETVYVELVAHLENGNVRYEFTRKVEKEIKEQASFNDIEEMFKFIGNYLGPATLGNIGVQIGKLGLA